MKTKVLICGATGFIGRNLTEQLSKRPDYEIHAVRYQHAAYDCGNDVIWHQADLRKEDDVDRVIKGMDIVIQTAATLSSAKGLAAKPNLHVTDNTIMNSLLFRAVYEHKINHAIFFSHNRLHHSSETPLKESDFDANKPLALQHAGLSNTKIFIEKMCEFYASISNTKFTTIRLPIVYGPHDKFDPDRSHPFATILTNVMTAKDRLIFRGTGEEKQDLLYIDDLVHFIEAAIAKQPVKHRVYHCSHSEAISTIDLTHKIIQHTGKALTIEHDLSEPTTSSTISLDCSLAENELGWKAAIDINTGIRKTIGWWRENVRLKVAEPA